ncbi:hypothetical protein AAMO2058_000154500 [Amorphochlora amoebiformis]
MVLRTAISAGLGLVFGMILLSPNPLPMVSRGPKREDIPLEEAEGRVGKSRLWDVVTRARDHLYDKERRRPTGKAINYMVLIAAARPGTIKFGASQAIKIPKFVLHTAMSPLRLRRRWIESRKKPTVIEPETPLRELLDQLDSFETDIMETEGRLQALALSITELVNKSKALDSLGETREYASERLRIARQLIYEFKPYSKNTQTDQRDDSDDSGEFDESQSHSQEMVDPDLANRIRSLVLEAQEAWTSCAGVISELATPPPATQGDVWGVEGKGNEKISSKIRRKLEETAKAAVAEVRNEGDMLIARVREQTERLQEEHNRMFDEFIGKTLTFQRYAENVVKHLDFKINELARLQDNAKQQIQRLEKLMEEEKAAREKNGNMAAENYKQAEAERARQLEVLASNRRHSDTVLAKAVEIQKNVTQTASLLLRGSLPPSQYVEKKDDKRSRAASKAPQGKSGRRMVFSALTSALSSPAWE